MRLLLLLFILSTSFHAFSQQPELVASAFKSANIESISPFMAETMDMDICGKGGVISRQQAQMLLDHFFKSNKVLAFHILHSSDFDNKNQHVIGEYRTSKGNFTLIYKLEEREGKLSIRQIRIDKAS